MRLNWRLGFFLVLMSVLWFPAFSKAVDPADQARNLYNEARFDLLDENYEAALPKLDRAHRLAPLDMQIILLKAKVLALLKRHEEAVAYFDQLVTKDPKSYGVLRFEAAYMLMDMGRIDEALKHLKAAEKLDFIRALKEQGLALMRFDRFDEAIAALKRLGEAKPEVKQEFSYLIAQAFFKQRKYNKALDALKIARSLAPASPLIKDIDAFEEMIKGQKRADRPWWVAANAGFQYDTNLYLNPLEDNPAAEPTRDVADSCVLSGLNFGYRVARVEEVEFGLTAGAQRVDYWQESDANYAFWSLGAYVSRSWSNWGVRVPYSFTYFYATADMEDRVKLNSVAPYFYWLIAPNLRTEIYGLYQNRQYFDGSPDIDRWGLGLGQFLFLGEPTKYLRFNARYDVELAEDDESGYQAYEFTFGGGRPIWGPLSFDLGLTLAKYTYDPKTSYYGDTRPGPGGGLFIREDTQWRLAAQVACRLNPLAQFSVAYFFTTNNSNVDGGDDFDPYEFSKSVFTVLWAGVF